MQLIKSFLIEEWFLGNPCPGGTSPSDYSMDSWGTEKLLCVLLLSVEDVEDIYVVGFMDTGFLLF